MLCSQSGWRGRYIRSCRGRLRFTWLSLYMAGSFPSAPSVPGSGLPQTLIVVVLFIADYVVGAWGVKKFGGSRASVIGSTIGLIIGPFLIPAFGLLIGPFLGAFIGELIAGEKAGKAVKVSFGALLGLFSSTVVKIILQIVMIVLFFIWIGRY